MAPLFSKVDLNKLWHDVPNEETLICAKFGKDLFHISKVIGRKKVVQFFLTHSVHDNNMHVKVTFTRINCHNGSSSVCSLDEETMRVYVLAVTLVFKGFLTLCK